MTVRGRVARLVVVEKPQRCWTGLQVWRELTAARPVG